MWLSTLPEHVKDWQDVNGLQVDKTWTFRVVSVDGEIEVESDEQEITTRECKYRKYSRVR